MFDQEMGGSLSILGTSLLDLNAESHTGLLYNGQELFFILEGEVQLWVTPCFLLQWWGMAARQERVLA